MKKAKLDLLEDMPGLEIEVPGTHQIPLDHHADEPVESSGKWALNKLFIIFTPLALIVLIIGGILFSYLAKPGPSVYSPSAGISNKNSAKESTGQKMQATTDRNQKTGNLTAEAPETGKIIYLKDFMIDLVDSKGNNYVLMCDVAFDIQGKTVLDPLENNTGVRNIIYRTAQGRSVVALRSVEERKKMKKELASELEKMLGAGSVKNVYFMNYFIM